MWQKHDGVTRVVYEEYRLSFSTKEEAEKYISGFLKNGTIRLGHCCGQLCPRETNRKANFRKGFALPRKPDLRLFLASPRETSVRRWRER
jgi:hypothetical protein